MKRTAAEVSVRQIEMADDRQMLDALRRFAGLPVFMVQWSKDQDCR